MFLTIELQGKIQEKENCACKVAILKVQYLCESTHPLFITPLSSFHNQLVA